MADPEATDPSQKRPGFGRGLRSFVVAAVIVAVLVYANSQILLPYYVFAPGNTAPVNDAISLPEDKDFPPEGEMLYATVSLIEATPFDLVWSQFNSNDEVRSKDEVLGTATPQQFLEESETAMDDSQLTATAVALRRANYDVRELGDGAKILEVVVGSPATGKLEVGQTIVSVNDQPVLMSADVGKAIDVVPPDSNVRIDVRTKTGENRTVDIVTSPRASDPSKSFIGVSMQTLNPRLDTPFPVKVDLGAVGGPSAGLAMSIALLDELTEGELTGGKDVAATGTIDLEGNVGQVGGLKQKVAAVRSDSGADLFLVPKEEEAEAQRNAKGNLRVVGVSTLDEAIAAIVANGGTPPVAPTSPG